MRAFRVILQGGSSPAIEALSRSRVTTSYLVAFLFAQKPLATSRTIIYNSPNALASRTLSRTPPRVVGQAAVPRLASIRLPSVKALRQAILLAAMTRTTSLKTQLRTNAEKLVGHSSVLSEIYFNICLDRGRRLHPRRWGNHGGRNMSSTSWAGCEWSGGWQKKYERKSGGYWWRWTSSGYHNRSWRDWRALHKNSDTRWSDMCDLWIFYSTILQASATIGRSKGLPSWHIWRAHWTYPNPETSECWLGRKALWYQYMGLLYLSETSLRTSRSSGWGRWILGSVGRALGLNSRGQRQVYTSWRNSTNQENQVV